MSKRLSKVICVIVALVVVLTSFTSLLFANERTVLGQAGTVKEDPMTLEVGKVKGGAAEIVTIPIMLSNVPSYGVNSGDFRISYDSEKLDIIDVFAGDIVKNPNINFNFNNNKEKGILYFLFCDETGLGKELITEDGIFATIKVGIKSVGEESILPFNIADLKGEFADYDFKKIETDFVNGGIIVEHSGQPPLEEGIVVEIGTVSGVKGDIVEIPIEFTNVPKSGIVCFDYMLKFDTEDLEIIGLVPGDIIIEPETDLAATVSEEDGKIAVLFSDESLTDERIVAKDGIFARVIARVKSSEMKFSPIEVIEGRGMFADTDFKRLPVTFVNGGIIIESSTDPIPEDTVFIKIATVEGLKGDIVEVPISFLNIPSSGINACDFKVDYDSENLEVIDIVPGEIVKNPDMDFSVNIRYDLGKISFLYANEEDSKENVISSDGEFATIFVKIKNEKTELLPIIISKIGAIADHQLKRIPYIHKDGGVSIKRGVGNLDKVTLEIGIVTGLPGDIVEIPVTIKDLPQYGIESFDYYVNYDSSVLDIISINNQKDNLYTNIKEGQIYLLFAPDRDNKLSGDFQLASITAKIKNQAPKGLSEIYFTTQTPYVKTIYPMPLYTIKLNNGGVTVQKLILGDLNGDGKIDSTDYVLLRRYVLEIIDEVPAGNALKIADLNDDGKINSIDCVLLRRYILEIISSLPREQ